jgi:hypothetical protein
VEVVAAVLIQYTEEMYNMGCAGIPCVIPQGASERGQHDYDLHSHPEQRRPRSAQTRGRAVRCLKAEPVIITGKSWEPMESINRESLTFLITLILSVKAAV